MSKKKSSTGVAVKEIEVFNPADEEKIGSVPLNTKDDANKAVEEADKAFKKWKHVSANERAEMLHEAARLMRKHMGELVKLITLEQGKPIPENEEELEWCINTFTYYAELGRHERGRLLPSNEQSQLNLVVKEPFGVVSCILPWNYPLLLLAWKVAPALAAGNTVVIKPSELTPLSTMYLYEHCLKHFPTGVVNVINGYGAEVGEPLVTHPLTRAIAFTGSVATGQRIASLAAPQMKKLHLELGGKDAFVITEDADPELTARALAYSALANAGQVCTSTERVYVPQKRKSEFTEAIVEFIKTLKIGPGLEPSTDIGPMIGDSFRNKVADHVKDAEARGAKVLIGGKVPDTFKKGYFYEPTVLVDVDHTMKIMKEETFGPTVPMMEYKSFEEAIELVNDSEFGLGACLLSNDPMKAKIFMEEVKAGTVWINDPLTDNYAGPFGGMKMSGGARELGQEGLDGFREVKHVHWELSTSKKSWWYPYGAN